MDIPSTPLALLKDPSLLKTAALVNGQWLDASNRFDVNDPATGLKLADVANLGPAEAEAAIAAANAGILAASILAGNDDPLLKRLDAFRKAQTDAVAETVEDAQ